VSHEPIRFRHEPAPDLVSCIVPAFDAERFVAEAIHSILAQTYPRREVIVVDDGSTDGTPAALATFGARIRVIRQENQGPSAARNRGLQESRGAFIAFLDADDLWVEDKLDAQMGRFRERPALELCLAHTRSFWIPELADEARRLTDHPYHRERLVFLPSSIVARRELFERVGGFDPALRHGEDTDWVIRMMRARTIYEAVPRLLLHRRQHTRNLTRQAAPSRDQMLALLKRGLDRDREARGASGGSGRDRGPDRSPVAGHG
jgi:glycosyltransferase involved in cell wall biosynthesis